MLQVKWAVTQGGGAYVAQHISILKEIKGLKRMKKK